MPHYITYYCSVNTSYSVGDKVGDQASPPGPWQHNCSKINLNITMPFKIKAVIKNKNKGKLNNQGIYWIVLLGRNMRTERKTPFEAHQSSCGDYSKLTSWPSAYFMVFSAHQPPSTLYNTQFHILASPACFCGVLPTLSFVHPYSRRWLYVEVKGVVSATGLVNFESNFTT